MPWTPWTSPPAAGSRRRFSLLWGATGAVGRLQKPAEVWEDYAVNIRGAEALPCGHYLSEEAPEETYRALHGFFAAP